MHRVAAIRFALVGAAFSLTFGCAVSPRTRQEIKTYKGPALGESSAPEILPYGPRFQDDRPIHEKLSPEEVASFKAALEKSRFPQAGGTVLRLLPQRLDPVMVMTGEVSGGPNMIRGSDAFTFFLDGDLQLDLRVEYYEKGLVDRSAAISRRDKELEKRLGLTSGHSATPL